MKDLGDTVSISTCQQVIVPLEVNNTICYQDVKLANSQGFIDKETHIIKRNSSIRMYNKHFHENIVKTTEGQFITFEPNLASTQVKNTSHLGDLSFNFTEYIEYIDPEDGLVKSQELDALSNSINYHGIKSILAESLFMKRNHAIFMISLNLHIMIHPILKYPPLTTYREK